MRILIGDRYGKLLGEIQPHCGSITTALNEIGNVQLKISRKDSKFTKDYLSIGNRVYIEFANGLPPWGGVIGLPRLWNAEGVTLNCYTIEYLLQFRITGKNEVYYERLAGEIFRIVLEHQEDKDPLGITLGSLWMGGKTHYPRYNYQVVSDVLNYSIRDMELCDYTFTPYILDNHIRFRADFYSQAGEDKSKKVFFLEGVNTIADLELEEQGEIVNNYYAIGEGSTWGAERLVVAAQNATSLAKYGLREEAEVFPGVPGQATLEMHAVNKLKLTSEPRKLFSLSVINKKPAAFCDYKLGDLAYCELPSFGFTGFSGIVRVLVREFLPETSQCNLVVEEPQTPTYWIYTDELEET